MGAFAFTRASISAWTRSKSARAARFLWAGPFYSRTGPASIYLGPFPSSRPAAGPRAPTTARGQRPSRPRLLRPTRRWLPARVAAAGPGGAGFFFFSPAGAGGGFAAMVLLVLCSRRRRKLLARRSVDGCGVRRSNDTSCIAALALRAPMDFREQLAPEMPSLCCRGACVLSTQYRIAY